MGAAPSSSESKRPEANEGGCTGAAPSGGAGAEASPKGSPGHGLVSLAIFAGAVASPKVVAVSMGDIAGFKDMLSLRGRLVHGKLSV